MCLRPSSEKNLQIQDFPGGPVVKNLPSNAEDAGSIPGRGTKSLHDMVQLRPSAATKNCARCSEDPARPKIKSNQSKKKKTDPASLTPHPGWESPLQPVWPEGGSRGACPGFQVRQKKDARHIRVPGLGRAADGTLRRVFSRFRAWAQCGQGARHPGGRRARGPAPTGGLRPPDFTQPSCFAVKTPTGHDQPIPLLFTTVLGKYLTASLTPTRAQFRVDSAFRTTHLS